MPSVRKKEDYEIISEGKEEVLRVNYRGKNFPPSLESSKLCMSDTIDKLITVPRASRVVFVLRKNYQYSKPQINILREIANLYNYLIKQKKVLTLSGWYDVQYAPDYSEKISLVHYVVLNLLKGDPIGAYVELKRLIREQKIKLKRAIEPDQLKAEEQFLDLLNYLFMLLDRTKLIKMVKEDLSGYVIGDRSLYKSVFRATITPDFMFARLMAEPPLDADEIDAYDIGDTNVMIFKTDEDIKYRYHVIPPEFKISEDKYELLNLARDVLSEHKPSAEEFIDPDKMRYNFFNIGRDLITELVEAKGLDISYEEIEELAKILVRYTVGFGLLEILLSDKKIQDVTINGPIGDSPIFVVHSDYGECSTNILPSKEDGDSWATRFRLVSGRPLDEANPVLDTELILPEVRTRVAVITNPLNPLGLGYALRRHRDKPWTLPLFMHNKMIDSLTAGLLSFLIDGSRTMLIAGTRGSGKTSLLGSLIVEIMRKYRVITIEDTLELPTEFLRKNGYNVQPMKVRSALMPTGGEISADEGIRTSLRMGDSSLIVGEVRSVEAKALYEAMRIGALANVVAGTIHGESPYGVFDRVVNDLGVPKTSFKATDVIVVANPVRSADRLKSTRRVVSLTEVRKEWENDPLKEGGFVDLLKYNANTDKLEPTDNLINGDSDVIKSIASNVKEWSGDWDAVWDNIMLRAKIKKTLVDYAVRSKNLGLLEAGFVINANDKFHIISNSVSEEVGKMESKRIFFEWNDWLKKQIKKEFAVS